MAKRRVRGRLWQVFIWLSDQLGAQTEAAGVLLVGLGVVGLMIILRVGGPSDWAAALVAFVVSAGSTYFIHRASRQHAVLIEVTLSFLISGGRALLDDLLGKLISGRWRREQLRPGDALFDVLAELCRTDDYEMRRRIAEALPALGEVDPRRSLRVLRVLREDWDQKWHSDLRRRAVEALFVPSLLGREPLLHRLRARDVASLLQLIERDEVYTVFAIAEALHEWEDVQPTRARELSTALRTAAWDFLSREEYDAVVELLSFLEVCRTTAPSALAERLRAMSRNANPFIRVAAARNVLAISSRLQESTLDLMASFLHPGQPKNVRRPIAREICLEFIARALEKPALRPGAEQLLLRLTTDADQIIKVTAFDKVTRVREHAPDLFSRICDQVLQAEPHGMLADRVRRAQEDSKADAHR